MLDNIHQEMIHKLHTHGKSQREISRILGISRNSVKKIISGHGDDTVKKGSAKKKHVSSELIDTVKILYKRCQGNVTRVKEVLAEEYDKVIAYSTLTDWVRRYHIKNPPKRAGCYHFKAGEEMQHDTYENLFISIKHYH